jgi:hypothetical protein
VHGREDVLPLHIHPPGDRRGPPTVGAADPARTQQRDPLVHVPQHRHDLLALQEPDAPASRGVGPEQARIGAHPHGPAPGGDPVAEAAVDPGLAGPQRRHRLAAGRRVLELGAHHGGQQAPPGVVGTDPDPGDRGHREHRPARHRQLARERGGGRDERAAGVHPERAARAVELRRPGPARVVRRAAVDRGGEERQRGAQLTGLERADGERCRQAGRPTS